MDISETSDLLVRHTVRHQDRMLRYIYSLVPNLEDAKEVLQETCLALLKNSAAYDSDRPFLPWAYRFAQLEVLKHRERVMRTKRVFDADVIELLARQRQLVDQQINAELQQLEHCMASLAERDRELIDAHYLSSLTASEIAERFQLSRRTLFRHLVRIRRALMACISTRLDEAAA